MSVQAITLALAVRGVSATEKLVLLALSNYADEHMQCWPSQQRLADDCCMTDRGVRGVLAELEARGLLSREHRRRADGYRASDRFTLNFAILVTPAVEIVLPEPASGERLSAEPASPENCANLTGTKRQFLPERGSGLTTLEPSEEPPLEPSKRERTTAPQADFEAFWAEWPDKRNKGAARTAYVKARRIASASTILAGVPNVTQTSAWTDGLRVHASTWLNGERWLDEPDNGARAPPATPGMLAAAAREAGLRMAIERANGRDSNDFEGSGGSVIALPRQHQIAS